MTKDLKEGRAAAPLPIVWCIRHLWFRAPRAERRAAVSILATESHATIVTLSGSAPLGPQSGTATPCECAVNIIADGIRQSESLQLLQRSYLGRGRRTKRGATAGWPTVLDNRFPDIA